MIFDHLWYHLQWPTVESRFLERPREMKIGLRNREFEKLGVKLQWNKVKGNNFWFELLGFLRNWGFEKLVFHCIHYFMAMMNIWSNSFNMWTAVETVGGTMFFRHFAPSMAERTLAGSSSGSFYAISGAKWCGYDLYQSIKILKEWRFYSLKKMRYINTITCSQ